MVYFLISFSYFPNTLCDTVSFTVMNPIYILSKIYNDILPFAKSQLIAGKYRFSMLSCNLSIGTASANSAESDHGCTLRIYFDNAGDNIKLTLYNATLTSRKPCNTITSVIAAEQTA